MSHQKAYILLAGCLVLSGFCASSADTTETTTTTVRSSSTMPTASIVSESSVVRLPATGNYYVVDPMSGSLKGRYDPSLGLVEGRTLQTGLVIVDKPTGNLVAIIDPDGRAVDVGVAPASEVLMVSIGTRRRDLDRQIADALNRGQLSTTQASALRLDLERIAADEAASRGNGGIITYRKALGVAYELNTLSQRLYPTSVLTPVISPQFVVIDKQVTMVDTITYRKLQLLKRIDDEYQAGRLSTEQVSRLKSQSDKISSIETRYKRRGELSASNARSLSMKLDQLESSLNKNVANINEKRARIGIRVN